MEKGLIVVVDGRPIASQIHDVMEENGGKVKRYDRTESRIVQKVSKNGKKWDREKIWKELSSRKRLLRIKKKAQKKTTLQ